MSKSQREGRSYLEEEEAKTERQRSRRRRSGDVGELDEHFSEIEKEYFFNGDGSEGLESGEPSVNGVYCVQ